MGLMRSTGDDGELSAEDESNKAEDVDGGGLHTLASISNIVSHPTTSVCPDVSRI
jgi:hypothetical protein